MALPKLPVERWRETKTNWSRRVHGWRASVSVTTTRSSDRCCSCGPQQCLRDPSCFSRTSPHEHEALTGDIGSLRSATQKKR